jgi:hypothetical protein
MLVTCLCPHRQSAAPDVNPSIVSARAADIRCPGDTACASHLEGTGELGSVHMLHSPGREPGCNLACHSPCSCMTCCCACSMLSCFMTPPPAWRVACPALTHHFYACLRGCLQRPNATWDVRQELSVLYTRFYASLMGGKCRPGKQLCSIHSWSSHPRNMAASSWKVDRYHECQGNLSCVLAPVMCSCHLHCCRQHP